MGQLQTQGSPGEKHDLPILLLPPLLSTAATQH